jgi:hypothetical protein
MEKMKSRILLLNILIVIGFGAVQGALGADITLTPKIDLTGQYDDNVSFEKGDKKNEDYLYQIQPAITFDYKTEINRLVAQGILDYQNYINNDNLSALNTICKLEGDSNFTELLTLFADLKYVKDNTLESQLEEEGKVQIRQDRHRYDLRGGLFFNLTELIRVGGDYRYRQTNYEEDFPEDYNDDVVSFIYNQRLRNQLDSLTFRTSYAFREVRDKETNTYRALFGWMRELSETFRFGASIGGRFTEQYEYNGNTERQKDETSGLLADFNFTRDTEIMRTNLNYHLDQVSVAEGEERNVHSFKIKLDRNMTERFRLGIDLKYYLSSKINKDSKDDSSQFYEVKPSVIYNLTEYHLLGLFYSYQHELNDSNDSKNADRNRVWVTLSFNFPRKL